MVKSESGERGVLLGGRGNVFPSLSPGRVCESGKGQSFLVKKRVHCREAVVCEDEDTVGLNEPKGPTKRGRGTDQTKKTGVHETRVPLQMPKVYQGKLTGEKWAYMERTAESQKGKKKTLGAL